MSLNASMTTKVLVVDDDAPTCELIREVLNTADIEARSVTDSATAATRLREQHFDAVFLDARMPAPDGIELTRQMRASGLNKKSLVVMITGDREQQILKRAFEAGVNFVLFKPIDRQALLRLLRVTQGPIDRERRRYTRVKVTRKVSIRLGGECARGTTEDLSVNGMLAKMDRIFPVGSKVQVNLDFNTHEPPILASARVVRTVGNNAMGLELENVAAADSERLQEFLAFHILQADTKAAVQVA
jgi:PleD family two-component response regulator